jgi:hypothetical protein
MLFEPLPADYPNHLAAPQPERIVLPRARWLLVLLVALCLVPRAMMALRIPSVCPDGVLYIHLAQAIEKGDLKTGFQEMALNIYPLVLVLLHRLGLDWELAASLWGVSISSLVVLPLWGWARRQFDDRVALVACLLYAFHPKLIEWSPEVMRDPTFWFLFVLAFYLLWRAVTEVRHGWFIAAGTAMIMASLARFEGLFLLVPFLLWTLWRWLALRTGRGKLLAGAVLCVVVLPALLLCLNLVWLPGHTQWTGIRFAPLARVKVWLEFLVGRGAVGDEGEIFDAPMTVGHMIWVFIPTMTRGLSPLFALLMFGGIWGWRKVWARRDHQPLFCAAVVVLCGIWVQLWYGRSICPRYALPIVLMALPFAALGLLGLVAWLLRVVRWLQWDGRRQRAVVAAACAVVVAAGLADAMTSNMDYFRSRRMLADVGRWLACRYSRPPVLVGPVGIVPIVSHYARGGRYNAFEYTASDAIILDLVAQDRADVVMLSSWRQLTAQRCTALIARLKQSGLEPINSGVLPTAEPNFVILVRADRLDLVQKATQRR